MTREIGKFEVPIYKHGIKLFSGLPPEMPKNTDARCEMIYDDQQINIYLREPEYEPASLIHEAVHAADFILAHTGADMGCAKPDSEVRAYLVEFIWSEIQRILKGGDK